MVIEKKRHKVSGHHVAKRRKISATLEQFVSMDRYIEGDPELRGLSWAQWALSILLAKIKSKQTAPERARVQRARR